MSADRLVLIRRAEHDMREAATDLEYPEAVLAAADWLHTAGADLWAHGPLCCDQGCHDCDDALWMPHVRHALRLARAYVGEQS